MHNSIEPTDCIQRLRTLPTEAPPPYNWQEFQRRSAATSRAATNWRPLAAAAALLLFVCAIAVWGRIGGGGRHVVADSGALEDGVRTWHSGAKPTSDADGKHVGARQTAEADSSRRNAEPTADVNASRSGAEEPRETGGSAIVVNRSRAIETWLASLPHEPAVVRVGTRSAIASLEDRIAQVDDLMTSLRVNGTPADRVAALQRERLRLVGSLAQVRYAEVVAARSP